MSMAEDNRRGPHPEVSASATRAAVRGTLWSIALKVFSFLCTNWTFRMVDPVAFGTASVPLELMLTTTLFLSREGFRLVLTKNSTRWNSTAWWSVVVNVVVASFALWIHLLTKSSFESPEYRRAGLLYCVAAVVEGCSEPCTLWCLRNLHVATKAKAEGTATLVKTLSLIAALPHMEPLMAFGVSQIAYAATVTIYMYATTWNRLPSWEPRDVDWQTCYLILVFALQGVFKHALTEGDRIVLAAISDGYHQGVYAMGSAYGGMAARLLLQPLEENGRLLWSRQPSEVSYVTLVKLVLYVGILFATVAVHYTSILLRLVGGSKWNGNEEASHVLSAFCIYTAFMAFNGMTEAFVYAVARTGSEVASLSAIHTAVGLLFAVVAPAMVSEYGTVGLVGANCMAMALRSLYAVHVAARFFQAEAKDNKSIGHVWRRLLGNMFPPRSVLVAFAAAFVATRISLQRLRREEAATDMPIDQTWLLYAGQHVAVGVCGVVAVGTVTIPFEREFQRSIRSMLREKQE